MLYLTGLTPDDFAAFGALAVLLLVGKFTRSESRALMAGLISVMLVPVPAALVVVSVLVLVFKVYDVVRA